MNVEPLIQSALQHHQAGRLKQAAALYEQVLTIEPAEATALHLLGVIAHQCGEGERAVALITRSTRLRGDNPDAFNNLGEAHRALGQFDEAVRAYKNTIAISPSHVGANYNLALALAASGDTEGALEPFEKARELAPDDVEVSVNFAAALHSLGKFDEALGTYRHVLTLTPQVAEVHLRMGAVYADRGNKEEALASWQLATSTTSSRPDLIREIFERMLEHGYLDAAIDLHRGHLQSSSGQDVTLVVLGNTLKLRRRISEAIDYFQRSLAESPEQPDIWLELTACFVIKMRVDEASTALDKAFQHGACSAYAQVLRSQILLRQFRWEAAEQTAREAISLDAGDTRAQAQLASVLFHRGDIESAASWYFRHVTDTRAPGAHAPGFDESFAQLTRTKLVSNIEQLSHLRSRGLLDREYLAVLTQAEELLAKLPHTDTDETYRFDTPEIEPFSSHFNRSLYQYRPGPFYDSVLSPALDVETVLETYQRTEPAVVCIEQLLSDEALQALQRFCTESSIWFQSRFRFEVGSNLPDGFSCPLLLQIAGELRERFSPILGPHLFKTCWAYKYYQSERPGHLHADDNAISFNVWITPDEANEDPGSGGLILWNKKVPAAYFDKPSERQAIVKTLTTAQDATSQTVPYGCNRAILFNGSVLHNSDYMRFKDNYMSRRISITFAFGEPDRT